MSVTETRPLDPKIAQELVSSSRWRVVPSDDGCLLWAGRVKESGYCQISIGKRKLQVHRVALVASLGRDIAPGLTTGHICHDIAYLAGTCSGDPTCTHRRCVNPDHLEEQTRRQNTLAAGSVTAQLSRRTHCPNGHELVEGNLIPANVAQGSRACRTCHRQKGVERSRAITSAHTVLGLSRREYVRLFGGTRAAAETVCALVDSGAPAYEQLTIPGYGLTA